GIAVEVEHARREEIRRRLVAGEEQQHAGRDHLVGREDVVGFLGPAERGQKIVRGLLLVAVEELTEVALERAKAERRALAPRARGGGDARDPAGLGTPSSCRAIDRSDRTSPAPRRKATRGGASRAAPRTAAGRGTRPRCRRSG